jgi:hypothetical protein
MKETKCMFLGGPIDGEIKVIPNYMNDYFITERKPEYFFTATLSVNEFAYIKHRYIRTTAKTFLHEDESQ